MGEIACIQNISLDLEGHAIIFDLEFSENRHVEDVRGDLIADCARGLFDDFSD
jgi:hypothetical protein